MAVLAGNHAGAAGSAERVCHITAGEAHSVLGYAVEVGGVHISLIVAAHHLGGVVVGHDVHYVERLLLFRLTVGLQQCGARECHQSHGF